MPPPRVRKCHQPSAIRCHQKSTSNSAGSPVGRWVLSTPPGHPAARRRVRVVPVLPLLLCTRPARARPSIGGQSPTPAPRQVPWSPPRAGALAGYRTRISTSWLTKAAASKSRLEAMYCLVALRRLAQAPPVADEVTGGNQIGVFRTPSKRKPAGAFLWLVSPHLK